MAILYRHIRVDKNEPFYIGIGKNVNRAYSKYSRNSIWYNITNKTNYEVEILFDNLTWEEAIIKEKEFIKLYGRKNLGLGTLVNMTDGGDGTLNYIYTENHRKLISEANKRRIISDKTRKKLSEVHKGKKLSPERYAIHMETVKKRKVIKGIEHHNYGKKLSEEQKNKLRGKRNILAWNSGKKRTDINGGKHFKAKIVLNTQTGIFYDYCKEAAILENIPYGILLKMLNGKIENKTNLIYA